MSDLRMNEAEADDLILRLEEDEEIKLEPVEEDSVFPWELFESEMVVEGEMELPHRKECDVCGARFSTILILRKHRKGEYNTTCSQVIGEMMGEEIPQPNKYAPRKKNPLCVLCQKQFRSMQHLKRHLKKKSGCGLNFAKLSASDVTKQNQDKILNQERHSNLTFF